MVRSAVLALLASFLLPLAALQASGPASLVADINTVGAPSGGGSPHIQGGLLPFGDRLLFAAWEPSSASEPWVSDGTDLGTTLLRDLCPGVCSSTPWFLGRSGEVAIFVVRMDQPGGGSSSGLWRTDGTREGTVVFKTFGFPSRGGGDQVPIPWAEVGGVVVFGATGPDGLPGLWRTDGTEAGTRRLADPPGSNSHPDEEKPELAGGKLFYFSYDSLWRTDGTEAGTVHLGGGFRSGGDGLFDFGDPRLLTPAGSRMFFVAEGATGGGRELWTSDGTMAGTRSVTRFIPEDPFPGWTLKIFDGIVYFVADDVTGGADLWRSDGTAAGTRRVTDFGYANPFGSTEAAAELPLGKAGNRLVFVATDGLTGRRIWTSNGTPAGTAPLAGCPGACPSPEARFVPLGNRVLFKGSDPAGGTELWSTDGTAAGTRRVFDVCPGPCSSDPSSFVLALGRLFFLSGQVLWATDGTAQGTVRLADLGPRPFDPPFTPPFTVVTLGGRIYFAAGDNLFTDRRLWTSDGTPEGTGLITLTGRNGAGSFPFDLTAFGNDLLFFAFDGQQNGLWRSGGAAASTVPLGAATTPSFQELGSLTLSGGLAFFLREEPFGSGRRVWRTDGTAPGMFAVSPTGLPKVEDLVAFRGKAVFTTSEPVPAAPTSFWESDGTVAGTRKLFDLDAMFARGLRVFGQDLYFLANAGGNSADEQVWASDGTAAGTRKLTDFDTHAFDSFFLPEMVKAGSRVFFAARDGTGERLWTSDGTAAGTTALRLTLPEAAGPSSLVEFQGRVYFMGSTQQGTVGRGLWKSDGTVAGTVLVKPVASPYDSFRPDPAWPTVLGSHLFFAAEDGEHGMELWRTDGTPEGTVLVRDIAPGSASSYPGELVAIGGRLYFRATNGTHGFELWESDGTTAGTRMVQDVAPSGFSSYPEELTEAGDRLFFRADDGISGAELWNLPLAGPPGCQPSEMALCLGGRFRVEATWRDFQGNTGRGHAVPLTGDTGYFWFFDSANVEVILKVLDGQGLNGHHWVFYGALSTVEYTLTVTDVETGASRRYINPPGKLGSVADTDAFGPKGATGSQATLGPAAVEWKPITALRKTAAAPCVPSATRLCLQGGRFAVEADWRDFEGNEGKGTAVPLPGGDTGYFWFFDSANVEVVLKVLDGRPLTGTFWVFYGALSSVQYTLTVTDTETGKVKKYENPSGRLGSVADTGAF